MEGVPGEGGGVSSFFELPLLCTSAESLSILGHSLDSFDILPICPSYVLQMSAGEGFSSEEV